MLHHFLFAPFPDALRQQQYEQVRAALETNPSSSSLLLGNLSVAEGSSSIDAIVVRPHSITILLFVPGGGRLNIPSLAYGAWQLDGHALRGASEEADNLV